VVEHEHVTVSVARVRVALDGRACGNGHGTGIALVGRLIEINADRSLRAVHNGVGDADGRALILPRAKVRMQADGGADEIDDLAGVRIDGCAGNVLVPRAVARERDESVEARALTGGHCAGSIRRCVATAASPGTAAV